jgi:MerR family mercuric resistance operon transcriptional regulator
MDKITIGRLARESAVNLDTIRYYERRGLLPKPPRSESGYRLFPPDAIKRVRFIREAQRLGFSLKEIEELLTLRKDTASSCADVRRRTQAKIADVEARIQALRTIRAALLALAASCTGRGPVTQCHILEALDLKTLRDGR